MKSNSAKNSTDSRFWPTVKANQGLAGFHIGIICIPGVTALMPGNVQNAQSFPFPVLYDVIEEIEFSQIACGDPTIIPVLIESAQRLVKRGVRTVVGACGSFGYYQRDIAAAIDRPVYMSILTQVPNILSALQPGQKLMAIFADSAINTPLIQDQCGIAEPDRLIAIDLAKEPQFKKFEEEDILLDLNLVAEEIERVVAENMRADIRAILLQCSDLPPFATHLRARFGLPVYDMVTFIKYLHMTSEDE